MTKQTKQETLLARKQRGPAPTGKGTQVVVRMQPDQLAALDDAIAHEGDHPTRPEMIRRIVSDRLVVGGHLRINSSDQDG